MEDGMEIKNKKIFTKLILIMIPILFLFSYTFLFAVDVEWMSGDVKYRHMMGEWESLDIGYHLANGDVIKTGEDGEATLLDGDVYINISPNSEFTVSERFDNNKHKSSFMLFLGRLKFKLTKKSTNEPEVVTQAVNLTVRGTEFDVASGHDGSTLVVIKKGVVAVSGKEKTLVLRKGEGSQIKFGEEPEKKFKVITKVIDWGKWLAQSRENIKGNELYILTKILKKFKEIDEEIKQHEKIRSESLKKKMEYLKLRDTSLAENKNDEASQYSKKAGIESKRAFHAIVNIRFLALSSIGLKDMADNIFRSIEKPSTKIRNIKANIDEIFDSIEDKYIYKGDRERLEKKSKKKKGCLDLF